MEYLEGYVYNAPEHNAPNRLDVGYNPNPVKSGMILNPLNAGKIPNPLLIGVMEPVF